ncbi:MAG TPA: MarR family transcriptional regulator [Isosphaeraceae bacterium]|jgi:predicted ArsR family transcriptional regulator
MSRGAEQAKIVPESSDRPLLDLIRRRGPLTVAEMTEALGVTPTAVRNRLTRLVASGLVERRVEHGGRGRPKHAYEASVEAHRSLGQNYAELAVVLWAELMQAVGDRKLRRVLFGRITERLAEQYRAQVTGEGWEGRLVQLGTILHDRGIEAEVARGVGGGPAVLRQHSCPYFELAEADRSVCALERKMFEKVLGRGLRLSHCRLDGHRSCDFEAKVVVDPPTGAGPLRRTADEP